MAQEMWLFASKAVALSINPHSALDVLFAKHATRRGGLSTSTLNGVWKVSVGHARALAQSGTRLPQMEVFQLIERKTLIEAVPSHSYF